MATIIKESPVVTLPRAQIVSFTFIYFVFNYILSTLISINLSFTFLIYKDIL